MGKKSWAWDKIVIDVPQLENNPFQDDFLQWMNSPAGERSEEALDTVWPLLDTMQVDLKGRKFIWSDGQRLGIAHTAQRIFRDHAELGLELIEGKVLSWLEMGYDPEKFSQPQLDDIEKLVDRWLKDHGEAKPTENSVLMRTKRRNQNTPGSGGPF